MSLTLNTEPVHVTEHSILRYLERAKGVDIDGIRRHIRSVCEGPAALSAACVRAEGLRFEIVNNAVVTVKPDSQAPGRITRERNQRKLKVRG